MKKQFITKNLLLLVLFILSGFLFISNASDKEKTFNVTKGDKLEVSTSNGNVNISIWNKDQAYIKAINIDEDDLKDLKIEQTGNKIYVEFKGQDSDDLYFEISIPAYLNLDISSGAGNISVDGNVTGKVNISTGGGNVSIKNIVNGPVEIATGGGM